MSSSGESNHSERDRILQRSRALLGWDLIQKALADRVHSPATESLCRSIEPEKDLAASQEILAKTAEMVSLLNSEETFPISPFEDVRPVMNTVRQNLIITPLEGLNLIKLLQLVRSLRRALNKKSDLPRLHSRSLKLDPVDPLFKELSRCISADGEIKENATPELRQALRDVRTAKQKLEDQVAKLLSSASLKDAVQDNYFTEREERIVLPIKAEWRSKIEGIVHDTSGSGQTLYMEPAQIVSLNNQLKINKLRVEQEKIKILQSLAATIQEHEAELMTNLELLIDFDFIHARALLARFMSASFCPANPDNRTKLIGARNPELILNGQQVVPNDISWDKSVQVIIISGPNTGGKTVTLKTMGLMSLMVRCGLFLPVAEGSEISFFPEIYADIGDDQNIQLSLSTFSGHLKKIIHILQYAVPGALILLDELGIATDPMEGASLAEAILKEMKRKKMMTLVSTHYLSLKTLAQTQDGFLNACTEFDGKTLAPTYRLIFGAPGHSAALETAERLGLPSKIIHNAREIYEQKDNRADILLQNLTNQRLELEREKEWIKETSEETQNLSKEQRKITERLRQEEKEFNKTKTKRLQTHVREGKNQIQKLVNEVKGNRDLGKLRHTDKKIGALGRIPLSNSSRDFSQWTLLPEQLKEGDPVLIKTYGATGILLENPGNKKKVRIKLGNVDTVVATGEIRGNAQPGKKSNPQPEKFQLQIQTESASIGQTSCDLRGMDSDEALSAIETFLSQAIVNKISRVKIIHGHGTGTIKNLVRDYLETTGRFKSFNPGAREEGGDGVTIVEL